MRLIRCDKCKKELNTPTRVVRSFQRNNYVDDLLVKWDLCLPCLKALKKYVEENQKGE